MNTAQIRFYADLSFFLPHGTSRSLVTYSFRGEPAIKDSIEAIGVPHPEVELILVDGAAVHFEYRLRDGDRVTIATGQGELTVTLQTMENMARGVLVLPRHHCLNWQILGAAGSRIRENRISKAQK